MKLYEISDKYQEILNGDPETGEINEDALNAISDSLEEKADNYAKFIANIDSDIEAIDTEIKRLQNRKKTAENKEKALKQNLMFNMTKMGKKKLKTKLFSFTIAAGGKAPLVFTGDVPDEYMVATYKPDNDRIRKALDDGKKLDFVEIGQRKESLRIK